MRSSSYRGLCAVLALLLFAGPGCREVSQPALDDAEQTLFPVEQDGQWGYINRKGEVGIEPQFEQAQYFSEDRARVRTDEGWGYINREGEFVIDPQFAQVWDFRNSLARVRTEDGRMGYVTRTGARVWPPAQ